MKALRTEFIGKHVEVNGINGKIVDETKNMLIIRDKKNTIKRFIKKSHKFVIEIHGKKYEINGKDIDIRPEERIRLKK